MNFGNLKRFSSKAVQKNLSFLCSGSLKMSNYKTQTVCIWKGERSSCSVTKLYIIIQKQIILLKEDIEVKFV